LGGGLLLVAALELLAGDRHFWLAFVVLGPPVLIAQYIVIVRHNRDVARTDAAAAGLHPERSLTGPNSACHA
jgi:hypothetical protein